MTWSTLTWKAIPPGMPGTSILGLPRPPAPLGPAPSAQPRLIPWVPVEDPRFGGNSVMEKTMSAIRGLHDLQLVQRQAANALLGVDYHLQCHLWYNVDGRRSPHLYEVRRSARWALSAQHSSVQATQQTQKALEDCAAHVVCTCVKLFINR